MPPELTSRAPRMTRACTECPRATFDVNAAAENLAPHVAAVLGDARTVQSATEWQGYGHVGATITDAILQAGLNYRTVVAPRVESMLKAWPDAKTVPTFLWRCGTSSLAATISWSHGVKLRRIMGLAVALLKGGVYTEEDLREFLDGPHARCSLLQVNGVGPKTAEYLRILVGLPGVPIDRHLQRFAAGAGVHVDRETLRRVYLRVAEQLDVDARALDRALWNQMAST